MENQELILRSEALLCEESTLSPEKEQAYISEITKLNNNEFTRSICGSVDLSLDLCYNIIIEHNGGEKNGCS